MAQQTGEISRYFGAGTDSLKLDTLSVVPGSLSLYAIQQQDSILLNEGEHFRLEPASALILFLPGQRPDSLLARYRLFAFDFSQIYARKDRLGLDTIDVLQNPLIYSTRDLNTRSYLDMGGLDYSGSFSRGLSFGNRQDVVLNSSLNLQLSGTLRDVEIEAAITDNNIPIQPEGNTQQLQEFDKVYIRLRRDPHELVVGDYELRRPQSYFMNLFRRLQGAQYRGAMLSPNGGQWSFGASAAVARGQYRRQFIVPIEGNQGPYLLLGNNNERFIIVLAGSERVYIDGELMRRGAENDYIIDYNAGEILFMPNRVITKDLRLQVEFEYAERSYFRSLAFGHMGYSDAGGKFDVRLNAFTEQDGRNQTLDGPLSSRDRNILESVGDSIQLAFAPAWDTASFDPGRILYRVVDSLGFDTVFVFSTNALETLYQVSFSQVGQGRGNYRLSPAIANGRVYEWVAPLGGIPQGDFEPVRLLPAPLSRQLVVLGADYRPFKEGEWTAEVALSRRDVNTFSSQNDADDAGLGLQLGFLQRIPLGGNALDSTAQEGSSSDKNWALVADARYEYAAAQLEPIENYRPMEFGRDWNLSPGAIRHNEHWLSSGLELQRGSALKLGYRLDHFQQEGSYTGWKNGGNFLLREGGFNANISGSYLQARTDSASSVFFRPRMDISQRWKSWTIRSYGEVDDIRFRKPGSDSLTAASIYYDLLQTSLSREDSNRNQYTLTHRLRRDKGPNGTVMDLSAIAHEILLSGRFSGLKNQRLQWTATWRDLQIVDSALISAQPEQAYLGRLEYGFQALSGLINTDVLYELGTASEPRRSFAYVQVPAGEGQYAWNDYNDNGIAELDEFEVAAFADQGNYIRVFTPSDEYLRADVLNAQYSISLQPKAKWASAKGVGAFLTRLSGQSIWQMNRKIYAGQEGAFWWPGAQFEDTSLLSLGSVWRNTLWFNRSRPSFGLEYTWQDNRNRSLLVGGPEDRRNLGHELILRAALGKRFNLRVESRSGQRILESESFITRDYELPSRDAELKLNYQSGAAFRVGVRSGLKSVRNRLGEEELFSTTFGLDGRYNLVGTSSLNVETSFVIVDFNGLSASPVGFAMLEGLQNGNNILWTLGYDRKLSRYLQLGLNYEGRKIGTAPTAHIGRAQLRAIF